MSDAETLRVYGTRAAEYAAAFDAEVPEDLRAFAGRLPPSGRVLDLGCGPGAMAGWLADQGFDVEAWDATPEMVARAGVHPGVTARLRRFEDLAEVAAFDGIWASFSLLHAERADLGCYFAKMGAALRPGGHVYVAMKTGTGAGRDALGRYYTYVTEAELLDLFAGAGLRVLTTRRGHGKGLAGTDDPYVTVTAHA